MAAMTPSWTPCDTAPDPPGLCALQQHPRYGAALGAMGADVTWLRLSDGVRTLGTAQVLRRRFGPVRLSYLPRGPALAGDMQGPLCPLPGPSLIVPDSPQMANLLQAAGHRAVLTPSHVAEIDLTQTQHALFAALHGKWRNRLRAAQSAGLRTHDRPFSPDRDADLLRLDLAQQRARRYTALPPAFTRAFAATHRQATRLFMADDRAGLMAFMLFLLHGRVATYHIGWAAPAARCRHAHTLLMWQAMTQLSQRGFARLDLGQIDTEAAPGLARFKLGTGATARPLGPTLLRLRHSRAHAKAA